MEEKEIWQDIEGYEGLYKVSNMGRVKSLNYNKTGKERILKAGKTSTGYLQVALHKDSKAKFYTVHRLVAIAFCENPHGFKEVNHIDEDKTNNCADNLEFCSRSYNANYGTRNQRVGKKVAEKLRGRKQSEEHIKKRAEKLSKPIFGIDKVTGLIVEFASAHEASRKLGINQSNITQCCKGKLNSCGGFYWMYANNNDAE